MRLVLGTSNRGKYREIERILEGLPLPLIPAGDIPDWSPPPEEGETFEANALIKARQAARAAGLPGLADDSGLVVPALGGHPGVLSARYAGAGASDEENLRKLLRELDGVPEDRRLARFVCIAALVIPGEGEWTFSGECEGTITRAPRGTGGFGYDPLFLIPRLGKTMAELSPLQKNDLSHRGAAFRSLGHFLGSRLSR